MSAIGLVGVACLVLSQAGQGGGAAEKPGGAGPATERSPPDVEKLPFTPDTVKQVIDYHLPQIRACYNEMLAGLEKPKEGMLRTSWEVTAEGLVAKAKVDRKGTTLKDSKLHECVVTVLSAMTFPKPPEGKPRRIEYPFNLRAQH